MIHSSKKSFDFRSGKLKSLELGTVKGDGAMATASKHVRKLLDGLANQAETAPLTHKVRDFPKLVETSVKPFGLQFHQLHLLSYHIMCNVHVVYLGKESFQ